MLRHFVKALKGGDLTRVTELLDAGAPLEHRGMWENTPLLVSTHYAHAHISLELLRRGADGGAVNEIGCTPLLYTCIESVPMEPVIRALADSARVVLSPQAAPVYSRHTDQTAKRTPLTAVRMRVPRYASPPDP